ncbi:MAG: peptidase domain-containing ABC transporter [Flavobacteriales bacterium]
MRFPFTRQSYIQDCGPTCLYMILKFHKAPVTINLVKLKCETTREGTSLRNIANAAEYLGFKTIGAKVVFEKLLKEAPLPCIVHWKQNHFVVVYKIKKNVVYVADPSFGLIKFTKEKFLEGWIGNSNNEKSKGVILLLEPTPELYTEKDDPSINKKSILSLSNYLFPYRKFLFQLVLGLIASSILQLLFPLLTQSVVDIGIQNQDLDFIYLVLFAQLFLFLGRLGIELIRSWILLHLSTRVNITLVSSFFIKLMRLPIAFFDTKITGDIIQRINDHKRVKQLLTSTSLSVLFSAFNLVIFGAILAWYDLKIFSIFLVGSVLYFVWVMLFLKRRKDLDYKRFSESSVEQSKVIELISGMQDIKLHNAEKQKRWSWEFIQARLYKVSLKSLALEQWQSTGSNFINEVKNIGISILSAKLVIDGEITLGMMMSVSYIVGQLNAPIAQIISFVHSWQDAKIALERLSEIHNRADEEEDIESKLHELPAEASLHLDQVYFRYQGSHQEVLRGVNLQIPHQKITAIVGASGSGKTTLMKMLLKFYEPTEGQINVGAYNLSNIAQKTWRDQSGVVMQDGYIFNDTIANNIAIGEDVVDRTRLLKAVKTANIQEFVESLPLGYNTKIGMEGVGISGGQKQRMLIARAVYKNPNMLFFDEATSALDAKNERIIMENLNVFFEHKTVIIIAHRLSTVKHADQIIVLDQGQVIEQGTHQTLIEQKGSYFNLVKNQLDLEKLNA